MNKLAKIVWMVVFVLLFLGPAIFFILFVDAVAVLLIAWLKPEWLDRF